MRGLENMSEELTKSDMQMLKNRLKVEWTYRSNAIEGNTISLGDTAFIIEYGLTIKGKSITEHNEVIGHAKAVDLVYELIKKENINKEDLFLLHKAVQTNLVFDIECPIGAYKVVANARYVSKGGKLEHMYYPLPEHTPYLMELFFDTFANFTEPLGSFERCVERYTDMHIAFSSIHPFFDGNGRVARLIANIPLLKNGYLPIIINNEERQEYIELLSNYNIHTKPLNDKTTQLLEKNEFYESLFEFFKAQYKNTQLLLDEIKNSRNG
ncbi:MAG: hypothetical protein QG560_1169 [Campylobacterota bacterium]|nr:hypothetical protein [Campylobacterota bacterium]